MQELLSRQLNELSVASLGKNQLTRTEKKELDTHSRATPLGTRPPKGMNSSAMPLKMFFNRAA